MSDPSRHEPGVGPARTSDVPERANVWTIVTTYAVLALLWFVFIDDLLALWVRDPAWLARLDVIESTAFIVASSVLLYLLLHRLVARQRQAHERARRAATAEDRALLLLRAIADNSPDAIFAKDRRGRYLLFNREAGRLTGKAPAEVLGQDDRALFRPEQARAVRANDERVIGQGRAQTFEEALDTADGRVTFLATKGPLRDADDRVIGMFGISRDITALLAGQAQLSHSEQRYRFIFDASPMPMWLFDRASLRFIAVNDALLRLTGFTREELLGMDVLDVTHETDREPLRRRLAAWQRGEGGGPIKGGLWRQLHKGGHVIEVVIETNDVEVNGRPARIGMARDVTRERELQREREAAHAQAVDSRDQLRDLLARIDDGFVALDTDWRYTYLSVRAAKMLGRKTPDDLLGRHIWTEFPESVDLPFHRIYHEAMATQQPMRFEEHFAPWDRWFENRIYPSPSGLSIYFSDVTERKRAERILQDRERDFRLLAEQMPAIIYRGTLDETNRPLYVSPHIRTLGFTPEEWLAQPERWLQAIHPGDRERVLAERRAGKRGGGEFQHEYRLLDAAGNWRHFRDSVRCIVPDDGSEPYVQGVAVDITDHFEAEIALRDSEAQLRLSEQRYRLAAMEDRVWEWDAESGAMRVSPEFWRILGLETPDKSMSAAAALRARMPAEDLERMRRALGAHLRDREPYDIEFRARDVAGRLRWFHTVGQAIWDEHGRATYMAGTTSDINDRKAAESALRQSEAYRRSLFEQLADGVLLLDDARHVLDANPRALELIGHPPSSLPTLLLDELLSPQDRERVSMDLGRLLSGGTGLLEWEIVRRDGSRFPAEVSTRAMTGDRLVAVLRDVSDRRDAERALLSYQLELSELNQRLLAQEKETTRRVAQLLHDNLGQTLAVARLNLDAAAASPSADVQQIRAQCEAVSGLLGQAVREVRQMLAELRPPYLDEQGLAAALDNEVRQRGAALGPDVLLEAEDAALGQRWPGDVEYSAFMIAREAIANARRHAGATLVRVLLGGDARSMLLQVLDDGIGIPAHLRVGRPGHLGLVGMRERAIAIGAKFDVQAGDSAGTRVSLRWSV